MKKLIIVAAIVCVAAMSQAASVKWTAWTDTEDYIGCPIYVCTAGASGFESKADIQNYLLGIAGNTSELALDDIFGGSYATSTVAGISDSLDGQTLNFTYVIVNESGSGYWTLDSSAQVYTTQGSHTDANDKLDAVFASAATPFSTGPTPVPEPTSGLMLILGMAGLALKRKRA